jgi:hypothetical protein
MPLAEAGAGFVVAGDIFYLVGGGSPNNTCGAVQAFEPVVLSVDRKNREASAAFVHAFDFAAVVFQDYFAAQLQGRGDFAGVLGKRRRD